MHSKRGSSWKLWFVIIALILVIAVLGFLCVRFFLSGNSPFRSTPAPVVDDSLSTKVAAQDANGKDVTNSISVTAGSLRPDTAEPDDEFTLLDIGWSGRKDASFPMIITVSDPAFTNNDGLAVYHNAGGVWELLGTYLIENNAVSFQTDSLSPFAFQVISSKPEPTATPEPTVTPEPTATPEPTPEPIDYGIYDTRQIGEFIQVDSIAQDGAYIIVLVDNDASKAANGNNAENSEGDSNAVTFFDAVQGGEKQTGTVLMNYDGTKLGTVEIELTKGSDGRYTITDTVTEGMLWTAVLGENYIDATRFSLRNNGKFLNLDDKNENVVMNDNETRTRWLEEKLSPEGMADFMSLTYRVDTERYFIKGVDVTEVTNGEGTATGTELTVPATPVTKDAKQILLFQLRTAVPTNTPKDTNSSGMQILTNTPSAIEGIDATPAPTATPDNSGSLVPVDPTAAPTAAPTQAPEEVIPTVAPESGSSTDAGSDATPVPVDDDSSTDA